MPSDNEPKGNEPGNGPGMDGSQTPQDPPNVQGDGGQPGSGDGGARAFSQADVDRIIQDRLARERQKYTDYEALKEQAQMWAEHEEAQKTELQKAQDRAATLEAERDQALAEANDRLIRAAFVAEAATQGAAHPEDAFALADLAGVEIGEGGQVTGVEEAVKVLVAAGRLPMSGRPRAPGLDGGAGGGEPPGGGEPELSDEEREIARKLGLTEEQYQKAKRKREA